MFYESDSVVNSVLLEFIFELMIHSVSMVTEGAEAGDWWRGVPGC